MSSKLFTPIELRGLHLDNRIVISPMCQYSADSAVHERDAFAERGICVEHAGRNGHIAFFHPPLEGLKRGMLDFDF